MRLAALALLLIPSYAAMPRASGPASVAPVQITEWTVPWEKTRPRDPYVDASGKVWFVGQAGNYIAWLNPANGEFKRIEIGENTHPHNLIVSKSGAVWYTGNTNGRILKLDPATGKTTTYMMPDQAIRDPHTMIEDKAGNFWFTAQSANHVGHLVSKTGQVHIMKSPTERSRPYGIVMDPQDRPWFVQFGSHKLATIDPKTMAITEHPLPNDSTRARRLDFTSDGYVWYGDYTRGMLGRYDPKTKALREWAMPSGKMSLPYAMAVDDKNRIWLVETGIRPNRLVGFDPKTQSWFSETPISQSGALTVRHMVFHKPTRSIWFGTDANTIGRAVVP